LLQASGLLPKFHAALDVFCLIEDESLRDASLKLIHDLRAAGLAVDYSLTPAKSDKQFKRAQELGAAQTVKLDRHQAGELSAKIKHLKTRQEKSVPLADTLAELRPS
jgi:histidyl-tRNA synthetase